MATNIHNTLVSTKDDPLGAVTNPLSFIMQVFYSYLSTLFHALPSPAESLNPGPTRSHLLTENF